MADLINELKDLHEFVTRQSLLLGQIAGQVYLIEGMSHDDLKVLAIKELHKFIQEKIGELYYKDYYHEDGHK